MDIIDPNTLNLDDQIITLSLYGNKISELNLLIESIKKTPNLKALWVKDTPVE